jgi:AraC-like DNA-binding protein
LWLLAWVFRSEFLIEIISLAFVIFVYLIGYLGYNSLYLKIKKLETDKAITGQKKKYEKSNLSEEEIGLIYLKLSCYIREKKTYLDPDLTLSSLAISLGIKQHKLSQVINEKFNMNFYDLINSYRIEEVKNKLSLPDSNKYTILSIAFDSGFNSKAAFYKVFRKYTGKSPSVYRNEINV